MSQDASTTEDAPGRLARFKTAAQARFARARAEHPGLQHVLDAWAHLQRNHGNQYAAAITFFSFLALFPLLLLGVSVAGFVLSANPDLQRELFAHLSSSVPGEFGQTLAKSIHKAIELRTSVGIVGLVGVLLTGLGWIGNLRESIDTVWGCSPVKANFVVSRVRNLLVLGGLGLALVVSLALTTAGTSLTEQILSLVHLDSLPGAAVVLKVLGIGLSLFGDGLIFWWMFLRLPNVEVPRPIALRASLLAAVGFEILKVVGTYTIAHTANSATAGPFAGILAVLVWIQLVCRWMLFSCAWAAVLVAAHDQQLVVENPPEFVPEPSPEAVAPPATAPSPAAVGATLVGAGAVAGAVASAAVRRVARQRAR